MSKRPWKTSILLSLVGVSLACAPGPPHLRYRQVWIGMEQRVAEEAYRGKKLRQSSVQFEDSRRGGKPVWMKCSSYVPSWNYSETLCFENGLVAVKSYIRRPGFDPTGRHSGDIELRVSTRVAEDRGIATHQFRENRRASLNVPNVDERWTKWRFVEPVPRDLDPRHDWDLESKSKNMRAYRSIGIGMGEREVAELPYFRGFPDRVNYIFITRTHPRQAKARLSRCELHGYVSFCLEDGEVVLKGIPFFPVTRSGERRYEIVVDRDYAHRHGLDGTEYAAPFKSAVDCNPLTSEECRRVYGSFDAKDFRIE